MADQKKIDTGTGGFPISDARYSYDTNIKNENEGYWSKKQIWSSGDVRVEDAPRDLVPTVKKTLASYLSRTTLGQTPSSGGIRKNPYPIIHDAERNPQNLSLRDSLGYVSPLTNTNDSSQPHFVDMIAGSGRSLQQALLKIVRGAEKPSDTDLQDGNELLRKSTELLASGPMVRGTVNMSKLSPGPVKDYFEDVFKLPRPTASEKIISDKRFVLNAEYPATWTGTVPEFPILTNIAGQQEHLSKVTKGEVQSSATSVDNSYPIEPPTDEPILIKINSNEGYPSTLSKPNDGQLNFFNQNFYVTPPSVFSGRSDTPLNILRGKEKPDNVKYQDGHKILPRVALQEPFATFPPPRGTFNKADMADGPVKDYFEIIFQKPGDVKGVLVSDKKFISLGDFAKVWTGRITNFPDLNDVKNQQVYASNVTKGETTEPAAGTSVRTTPRNAPSPVDNAYSISPPLGEAKTIKVTDSEGYPSPLSEQQGEYFTYLPAGRSTAPLNVLRGREKPVPGVKTQDGNILLKNATRLRLPDVQKRGIVSSTTLADGPIKDYFSFTFQKQGESQGILNSDQKFETSGEYSAAWTGDVPEVPKGLAKLAQYLSDTTFGKSASSPSSITNSYPIKHLADENPRILKTTTEEGYSASLSKTPESQPQFEKSLVPGDGRGKNFDSLLRGREKIVGPRRIDGNTLLKDYTMSESKMPAVASSVGFNPPIRTVPLPETTNPINEYYGDIKNFSNSMIYNRFNPDAKFAEFATPGVNPNYDAAQNDDDKVESLKRAIFQKPRFYEMGKSPSPVSRGVSYGILSNIGPMLTYRASAETLSFTDSVNPDVVGLLAASLPGAAQLGLYKVEKSQLTAGDVIDNIVDSKLDPIAQATKLINPAGSSWGVLNNVNDEFSSFTDVGMQLLTAALVITINISFRALGQLIQRGNQESSEKKDAKTSRYSFGKYYSSSKLGNNSPDLSSTGAVGSILLGNINFLELLGIQATKYPYEDCLTAGLLQAFGIEPEKFISIGEDEAVIINASIFRTDVAKSAAKSPGYYAVLARAVNRSLLTIGDSFLQFGKNFASGFADPIGSAKKLFSIVDSIRNSKFLKIANTFAKTGDLAIDLVTTKLRNKNIVISLAAPEISTYTLNQQGILDESVSPHTTLSWATHRAPDFLVRPNYSITSNNRKYLGMPSLAPTARSLRPSIGKDNNPEKTFYKDGSIEGRISTEDRERYEDSLEGEYMPFYLQDVRTNEILSFHAFLASLNDSYTSNYDSVDAIGRVETLKIYKSTNRKVDFSFWLVSTSPEDFDSMWLKINKLTTMAYPQFSKGRRITDPKANYSIYAPFSQTIQASPLVRLRIGDLIKSNYSKFNLARLFGYSYKDTKFNKYSQSNDLKYEIRFNSIKGKYEKNPPIGSTWFAKELNPSWIVDRQSGFQKIQSLIKSRQISSDTYFLEVIENSSNSNEVLCEIKLNNYLDVRTDGNERKFQILQSELKEADFGGRKVKMPIGQLEMTDETEKQIQKEATSQDSEKYDNEVRKFMSETDGNIISKSFRSSGGKGLAGFIESLNFEWPVDKQWEIGVGEMGGRSDGRSRLGRRAPMICKATISFSPMHDITPGLDHVGMNRAPIYSVGPFATNDMRSIQIK